MSDYRRTSSVTAMLQELGWSDLADRRRDLRLALLFKITHQYVAVPAQSLDLRHSSRDLRDKHDLCYHTFTSKSTTTEEFTNSFIPRTVLSWNLLDREVVEACSIDSFKSKLAKLGVPRA